MAGKVKKLDVDEKEVEVFWSRAEKRLNDQNKNLPIESVIFAALGTVKCYMMSREFYLGLRPVQPKDWLSTMLRDKKGVIAELKRLNGDRENLFKPDALTPEQIEGFEFAFRSLQTVFEEVFCDRRDGVCGWHDPLQHFGMYIPLQAKAKRQGDPMKFFWLFWNLVSVDILVYYREIELWDQHPEWAIREEDWAATGPDVDHEFLHGSFKALTKFLKAHRNADWNLAHATLCLEQAFPEGEPAAFRSSKLGVVDAYDACVREALIVKDAALATLEDCCFFGEYPWLVNEGFEIERRLHDFFVMNWKECHPDAERFWIEADAELMTHWYIEGTIGEADADRIIELANRAAREDWVLKRLEEGYDGIEITEGRSASRKGNVTHLEDGQFQELISMLANSAKREVLFDGVTKEGGKALREAMKDKGGPTVQPKGAPKKLTQKEVAELFGPNCNVGKVSNWESYGKKGVKRGATPPCAEYKGKLYSYSKKLRENPTPEYLEILGAIAKRFRETSGVQDGIETGKFTHPRSEEALYRAPKG